MYPILTLQSITMAVGTHTVQHRAELSGYAFRYTHHALRETQLPEARKRTMTSCHPMESRLSSLRLAKHSLDP